MLPPRRPRRTRRDRRERHRKRLSSQLSPSYKLVCRPISGSVSERTRESDITRRVPKCPRQAAQSEGVTLLLPVVGVIVVPVALPEAGLVVVEELEAAEPFCALPEVAARNNEPERPAVLGFERLAVGFVGDHRLLVFERFERDVRGEALLRVGDHKAGARLRLDQLGEIAPVDAAKARVETAPAGDAVDVDRDVARRQLLQLLPGERDRILDLAEDLEVPGREVGVGHGARVQDGPLLGQVLPRRQACGVVTGVGDLLFCLGAEHDSKTYTQRHSSASRHLGCERARSRTFWAADRAAVPAAVAWTDRLVNRRLADSGGTRFRGPADRRGATGLGIVLAAFTIGRAAFVVVGGVWADRLPRRAVMITADLVRFCTQAITAALLLGHLAQVWELAALQAFAGAAGGVFAPASTALVPQTVSVPRLQQANALLSLSQSATNIFGPALSGVIVAV